MENTTLIQPTEKRYLTQDELSQIRKLNEDNQELIVKFGTLEFQIQSLVLQKDMLVEDLENNKASETKILQKIKSKYGDININLETGEITQ